MQEKIEVGFQVFASDGGEEFGAVRYVSPSGRPELVIYIENAGDFTVPMSAVDAVHSEKVILNCTKLDRRLRRAIIRSMKGRPAHHAAQREDLPLDRRRRSTRPTPHTNRRGLPGPAHNSAAHWCCAPTNPTPVCARACRPAP